MLEAPLFFEWYRNGEHQCQFHYVCPVTLDRWDYLNS